MLGIMARSTSEFLDLISRVIIFLLWMILAILDPTTETLTISVNPDCTAMKILMSIIATIDYSAYEWPTKSDRGKWVNNVGFAYSMIVVMWEEEGSKVFHWDMVYWGSPCVRISFAFWDASKTAWRELLPPWMALITNSSEMISKIALKWGESSTSLV